MHGAQEDMHLASQSILLDDTVIDRQVLETA